jgi:hypothetical protein
MRRQTVRLCSECGKIRTWLAKIGGINLCDTMLEVSLLPARTYERNICQWSGEVNGRTELEFAIPRLLTRVCV